MKHRLPWIALAFCLMGTSTAWPDISPYSCQLQLGEENNTPRLVKEILASTQIDAVEICRRADQASKQIYYALSPVVQGPLGACIYTKRRIILNKDENNLQYWDFTPPPDTEYLANFRIFMMKPEKACRPVGNPGYVLVVDVSEGVFLRLVQFLQYFVTNEGFSEVVDRSLRPIRLMPAFESLEAAIAVEPSQIGLVRIGLETSRDPQTQIAIFTHYQLQLLGKEKSWGLDVDFAEDGPVLLAIYVIHE